MEEERNSGAGFENRDSFAERMNSNMSIDRFTLRSNSPTVGHKISLIEAMDLQLPDRKSDFYNNVLGDHRRSSNYKRQSNASRNDIFSRVSRESQRQSMVEQVHHNRNSNHKHMHECSCLHQECNREHCNCFLYPNELCVIGLCCLNCVKIKNEFLSKQHEIQSTNGCLCKNIKCLKMYCSCYREGKKCNPKLCKCEGCQNDSNGLLDKKKKKFQFEIRKQQIQPQRQNNHLYSFNQNKKPVDPTSYSFVNCSCKKSHCLKKYCSCFINNKSCTESCSCEDCHNKFDEHDFQDDFNRKARYARHDDDDEFDDEQKDQDQIDQFLQKSEKEESQDIPSHMQFEPVNFENIGR